MWTALSALAAPLETEAVSASGRDELVVRLPAFGRYAFEVRSASGTALQLVERDAGPGPVLGSVGERDGRIDAFFDVGEVLVRTRGPDAATGEATVTVTAFDRVGSAPKLPAVGAVEAELADRQERAWWVELTAQEDLAIEAVGRHLADLRIWRDGAWLVDGRTTCSPVEPEEGRPQQRCVALARLEPGLYQVSAYGGPGAPWAEEAPDRPLVVSRGLVDLPASGRRVARVGPTGVARFRVPAGVDTAHLTLPEIAAASVELQLFDPANPFADRSVGRAAIDDTSRVPAATARGRGGDPNAHRVITVRGAPGQRYALDWFTAVGKRTTVSGSSKILVVSSSTANPADELDPTAVFWRSTPTGDVQARAAALRLGDGQRWTRRFNLLEPADLLLEVDASSAYAVRVTEGDAAITVQRWFSSAPPDWRAPEAQVGSWSDTLEPGLHLVKIAPRAQGIATVEITRGARGGGEVRLLPAIREVLEVDAGARLSVELAGQSARAVSGLSVRELPLDPSIPASIPLAAGERYALPVEVRAPARLRLTGPDGEPLPLAVLDRSGPEIELRPGSWSVILHNPGARPVVATLGVVAEPEPPIPLPAGRLAALPKLPPLAPDAPWSGDLDAGSSASLAMKLPTDGLWTVESTGLLATSGSLRSRVQVDLGSGDQNGVGRNFRVSRPLRSGDYQVTVRAVEPSAGHLGVRLSPVPMREGGALADGVPARATLPAGEGATYRFTVDARSTWTVRSAGATRAFGCRLEDAEGWPVVAPADRCELRVALDPGSYVLRLLPEAVETRRITLARMERSAVARAGHGPFALALGEVGEHTWEEPPGDGERPTDVWTVDVPAELTATVELGDGMGGALLQGGRRVAELAPGRTWTGRLERGEARLELRAARRGTGVPYTVAVRTDALTVGQARDVALPARIPVRVGVAGPVTLWSTGEADVRARLLDGRGRVVAANDDRPDDWNFRIDTWLEPGEWTLELQGSGDAWSTRVAARTPPERDADPLKPTGKPVDLPIDDRAALHPLDLPGGKEGVRLALSADTPVAASLQARTPEGWRDLASGAGPSLDLYALRSPGQPVRLRVVGLDGRPGAARATLIAEAPRAVGPMALAEGGSERLEAVSTRGVTPGLYRVAAGSGQVSGGPGQPFRPLGSVVALGRETVIFGRGLRLERAELDRPVPVELGPEPRPMATGSDGLVAVELRSTAAAPRARLADGAFAVAEGASLAIGSGDAELRGEGVGRVRVLPLVSTRHPWDRATPSRVELAPGAAILVPMPRGEHRVELHLERGVAARLGSSALWADREGASGALAGSGDLIVANVGSTPAFAELVRASEAPGPVGVRPREGFAGRAGVEVIPVSSGAGVLRVAGARVTYARADGLVLRGDPEIGPGGTATVEHGAGWWALWAEAPGAAGPWPVGAGARGASLAAGVHRVAVDGPFAARVTADGRSSVVWRPDGGAFDIPIRQRGELEIRGLGGGEPAFTVSDQVVLPLAEGLGPEVLLGSGGSRWFRFEVPADGPVGVGVRASADRVRAAVFDAQGELVGEGVVQRLELPAGSYHLVLSQPAGAPPVRCRPAVAGLVRPDTGPPDEVVRTYLSAEGGER